jgi:hypothetical protein
MQGIDNNTYIIAYFISNLFALLMVLAATIRPRLGRLLFFLLFCWASLFNGYMAATNPGVYLMYAPTALSDWYSDLIKGVWFATNGKYLIGTIAAGQGIIALGVCLKGWIYRWSLIGAIVFLLAIMPLGMGSAFPCTISMAVAALLLLRNNNHLYIWQKLPTGTYVS